MRFRQLRHTSTLLAGAIALAAAACGGGTGDTAAPDPPPPVLAASAVAYLSSTLHRLTVDDLAAEARRTPLAADLARWGFSAAAERTFQGESARLRVVDSRTIDFARPAGARSFVAFVHAHIAAYIGSYPTVRAFTAGGRSGWTYRAQSCACPGATPVWLAVASAGRRVTWLEINGPEATARALASLSARAP